MKKEDAIKIITDCAKVYRDNLANRNFLFVFQDVDDVECFEAICLPRNYLKFRTMYKWATPPYKIGVAIFAIQN